MKKKAVNFPQGHDLKNKVAAFTLIELLVVMVVISFMMTIISPWLFRAKPAQSWPALLERFNGFVYFARQEAISTNKVYRVFFKYNKPPEPDSITVEEESDDSENPDKKIYKQVFSDYFETRYNLPESAKMVAFYKGKVEQFSENKFKGYCYVVPNGLVEDVMIHIVRLVDDQEEKGTFKMSSFIGKFEYKEGFTKPEK